MLISPINDSDEIFKKLNGKNIPFNNFNETFYAIKKNLHIKQSRKYQVDSLLKKAKCKFFHTIHKIMNFCLAKKIKRLPQPFITNITIEYNKYFLDKTIIQVYNEFNLIKNLEIIDGKLIKIKKKELFLDFSKYKLDELYKIYIESQSYKKDLKEIVKKNGKNIGILYEFVSKNLIYYYKNNKSKVQLKKGSSETNKKINNDVDKKFQNNIK
jgi:hypothetical protein